MYTFSIPHNFYLTINKRILDKWNSAIGGKVIFRIGDNPESPVKIMFGGEGDYCGYVDFWEYQKYSFVEYILKIKEKNPSPCVLI